MTSALATRNPVLAAMSNKIGMRSCWKFLPTSGSSGPYYTQGPSGNPLAHTNRRIRDTFHLKPQAEATEVIQKLLKWISRVDEASRSNAPRPPSSRRARGG